MEQQPLTSPFLHHISTEDTILFDSLLLSFFENTTDGIVVLDLEGTVLAVNRAFEMFYGWKREELLGKGLPMIPLHLKEEWQLLFQWVMQGKSVNGYETYRLRSDGSHSYVSLTVSPIKNNKGSIIAFIGVERDITRQKVAVMKLQESEERYRQLVELSPEPIIVFSDYEIVYVNPAAVELIGASNVDELVGKFVFELLHPSHLEDVATNVVQLMNITKPSDIVQKQFRRLDKEVVIDVELKAIPITYLGKPSIQLLCRDITERKKVEKSLHEAESLYKSLVENALIGVYLLQDGERIYVNPYLINLFGYSPEEFAQKRTTELLFEEDWEELAAQAKKTLNNESECPKLYFNIRGRRKDGKIIYFEGNASQITYKDKPAVFMTIQDITYKKETEDLLLESALRYQRLIKFLPEPIVVCDEGVMIYANKSAMRLFKAANEMDLIGRSIFDFLPPEDHEAYLNILRQVMQTDAPSRFHERKLLCTDGEVLEVDISSIRIHNYRGKTVALSVLRDLTERKRVEESVIQSEKLSVIGQLAAGVAHEIRNPLTALKGFCQLLKSKYEGQVSYFDIMLNELDRINIIVNEFMTLAKPHITQFSNGDVNAFIKSVIPILETQAILMNVHIEMKLDHSLPYIYCEENQLKQVFINIIKNGIEAMPHGGNLLIVTEMTPDGYVRVVIKDHGKGIPEQFINKIGVPFFTTKESGTGLGLMICHRIIEGHSGTIQISSKKGEGTTVDIRLPSPSRCD